MMHGLRIIFCLLLTSYLSAQTHTPVFPELTGEELLRAYCESITSVGDRSEVEVKVYPNPVVDVLHIAAAGQNDLKVIDTAGRIVAERLFSNNVEVDFSNVLPGTYFVLLGGRKFRAVKQ